MADLWDTQRGYVRVVLRNVQTEAQIGLHPWEQHEQRPTRLLVNVEMFAHDDTKVPATRERILDYDTVRAAIRQWPQRAHTPLLETLAEELVAVCFANPLVEACRVSVMKPDIFNDADGAGVELYRRRTA